MYSSDKLSPSQTLPPCRELTAVQTVEQYQPGETSDRLHYCLNSHSNSHESQPLRSVSLPIISTGPFRISAPTEHVRNNKPQCP